MRSAFALSFSALAALSTGCTNYDFARARLPDGSYDVKKLAADLAASKVENLRQGIWIPLIHMDVTTFGPSKPGMPKGHELLQTKAWGPLFLGGCRYETFFDDKGETVESIDTDWALWGVAYYDRKQRIPTPWGKRLHSRHALLLLFGGDNTIYATPEATSQP